MIKGVIFDLDGVIVSTDEFHYRAWKRLADDEGIHFDRSINERLRGVGRLASLDIILERSTREYGAAQKADLAERKNGYYRSLLADLTPGNVLPGARDLIASLKARSVKVAIGSSSKNAPAILKYIDMADCFDAVADGNCISRSKPDPEIFLKAAGMLSLFASNCLVVEDAEAGVMAAIAAGMRVLAVGTAANSPNAHLRATGLDAVSVQTIIG